MTVTVDSWQVPLFEGWGGFRSGDPVGAAERLARELTDNDAAEALVPAAVVGLEGNLADEDHAYIGAGLWVPDPATGAVYGGLLVELLDRRRTGTVALTGPEEYAVHVRRRRRRKGVKVLGREVEQVRVDAGPAVVVTESCAERRRRAEVSTSSVWTVFPGDSVHAVQLEFTTWLPGAVDDLLEVAVDTVSGLRVELAPFDEAGPHA